MSAFEPFFKTYEIQLVSCMLLMMRDIRVQDTRVQASLHERFNIEHVHT
jgi:hypothetical protein